MRSISDIQRLLPYLTKDERDELTALLAADPKRWRPLPGPQTLAYESQADITGYGGAAGGGKASDINSLVLTPKGWRKIGDLRVGDKVTDPTTGGSTDVIGVFPQGEQDIYEVETDDGAKTRVVDWHLWSYKPNGHTNRRPRMKGSSQRDYAADLLGAVTEQTRWSTLRVGSTTDLMAQVRAGRNPRLPLMEPALFTVNGRTGTGAIDPYLIGLMLGDGCARHLSMSSADDQTQDYLTRAGWSPDANRLAPNGRPLGWIARGPARKVLDQWLRSNGLRQAYAHEKFVPDYVLTAPIAYRLAVLQGLMDTDGTADERGRCYFTSTSERLAQGVRDLARSLGGKASIRLNAVKTYTYLGEKREGRPSWQVRLWVRKASALFRLKRKADRCTDRWNGGYELMREVVRVEKVGRSQAVCIKVASPYGLYVTDDYLVTHNTDLACGLAIEDHRKVMILRRVGTELTAIVDRLVELMETRDGYNGQQGIFRATRSDGEAIQVELGAVPNLGDERKYQGRPHDLIVFDEAANFLEAQVRFLLGWLRTTTPGQRCRALLTFNPPTSAEGRWIVEFFAPWLDDKHPNPAMPGELRWFATVAGKDMEVGSSEAFVIVNERPCYEFDEDDYPPDQIVRPMSRTFIPSRVADNPYLTGTGYMSTLQALPEPLRSQMLNGDFKAGMKDDPWQVIPTEWVDIAMARWTLRTPKPELTGLGVDVARGGDDKTVIARKHDGLWFDELLTYAGATTPDGPSVAGLVLSANRDHAPVHIDVIGVGASPYDFLLQARQNVLGVNVSEKSHAADKSGRLRFFNQRSELWWKMREALDPQANNGIALPPDKELRADLCAPTWKLSGATIQVESRDDIVKRIGRSPDKASALCLALIDTPKMRYVPGVHQSRKRDYDPMALVRQG